MAIDLTVVIPTYNRRELLEGAVRSLRAQSHARDRYEIIIVSDGSTDGTDERYAAPLRQPATRLLRREKDGFGLAAARNLGVREAAGSLVLFLDDDMIADPGLVATHIETHARFDDSVAVCGRVEPADDVPSTPFCRLILSEVCHGFRDDVERARFISFESAFSWQTSFKAETLRGCGGYDESFRRYGWEDIDFAYRASRQGVRFFYEPAALSRHRDRRDTLAAHGERLRNASHAAHHLFRRHPELRGRIPMYADKEPIDWQRDAPGRIGAKAFRALLATPPVHFTLRQMTPLVERVLPSTLLRRWYHGVLGGYVLAGYREGLAEIGGGTNTAPTQASKR